MTNRVHTQPFGDLAEFRNGVNFSADSRGTGDLAIIGVGDFKSNERLTNFGHLERIKRPKSIGDEALLRDGDLVFVRSNGNKELIGRCMVLAGIKEPTSHSGFTIRARITSKETTPDWIGQYFSTGLAKRDIMRRGGGTNISNLSQQILQDLPIPVPNRAYQERVLNAARRFSSSLQLLDAALAARHKLKTGLLQQLVAGHLRFPGLGDSKWKAVTLGDVLKSAPRKMPKPKGAFLSAGVRSHGKGVFLKEEFAPEDIALDELFELKADDLVVNITFGWEGAAAIVPRAADGALVSHRFPAYVINKEKVLVEYMRHFILTKRFVYNVGVASPGGAGRNRVLNRETFLEIPLTLPQIDEQRRIADLLNLVDREVALLSRQRELVQYQKRELLSGLLLDGIAAA